METNKFIDIFDKHFSEEEQEENYVDLKTQQTLRAEILAAIKDSYELALTDTSTKIDTKIAILKKHLNENELDINIGKKLGAIQILEILRNELTISALSLSYGNKTKSLVEELKQLMISTYRKKGDTTCLLLKDNTKRSYTGNELADEIERETDFGIEQLMMIINLTIDLLSRDKINSKTKDDEIVELKETIKKLEFMIENGLSHEDMKNDITYPRS